MPTAEPSAAASGLWRGLDELLLRGQDGISLLRACQPANSEETQRVCRGWLRGQKPTPQWRYAPMPAARDFAHLLERALSWEGLRGEVGRLYAARVEELLLEARLVSSRGTGPFRQLARQRFALKAYVEDADLIAKNWLLLKPSAAPKQVLSDDVRDPDSLIRQVESALTHAGATARVEWSQRLSSVAAAGEGLLLLRPGVPLAPARARRIALHEVYGHLLPLARSRRQPLGLFRVGSRWGADAQEGWALSVEEAHGVLDGARKRELALRHLAARDVQHGADFVEVVTGTLGRGCETSEALEIGMRVFRGGGLARESAYLPAYLWVQGALREDPALGSWLQSGRLDPASAHTLRALGFQLESEDAGEGR